VFDDYLLRERQCLEACAPTPPQSTPAPPAPRLSSAADYLSAASMTSPIGDMFRPATSPDPRSREEYLAEIDQWEDRVKSARGEIRHRICIRHHPAITPPTRIEACSQSYLEEVKIKIRLDGPVRGRPKPADPSDFHDLPSPARPWGPESIFPSSLIDPAGLLGSFDLTNMATHSAPTV
jgi:hypothetical protein